MKERVSMLEEKLECMKNKKKTEVGSDHENKYLAKEIQRHMIIGVKLTEVCTQSRNYKEDARL